MKNASELTIIGDREAAKMFGYEAKHIAAFQKKVSPSYKCPAGQIDIRLARPIMMGRKRRWIKEDIERLIIERLIIERRG